MSVIMISATCEQVCLQLPAEIEVQPWNVEFVKNPLDAVVDLNHPVFAAYVPHTLEPTDCL